MMQSFIFIAVVRSVFWFYKLIGLCPFHYNFHKKSFNLTKWEVFYTIFVWVNFTYLYAARGLFTLAPQLNPLVMTASHYLALFTINIIFMMQCVNASEITTILNEAQILLEEINSFCKPIPTGEAIRYLLLFLSKMIFISGIVQMDTIAGCIAISKMVTGEVDYVLIFIISLSYFLQTAVLNMFYSLVLVTIAKYQQLNCEIREILDESSAILRKKRSKNGSDYDFDNRLFQLSERMNRIAHFHGKLTLLITKANKTFSLQLLVVIGNTAIVLLIDVSVFQGRKKIQNFSI